MEVEKAYKEHTLIKILYERDAMIAAHYANVRRLSGEDSMPVSGGTKQSEAAINKAIMESVNPLSREHSVVSTISQLRAQIMVISRVLDTELVRLSWEVVDTEHRALLATYEQAAASDTFGRLVKPNQQFASTHFQQVDTRAHLDVCNKLSFVQTFLTKLRNRCTEVETLASGPGIVFSLKDFNQCLQNFCQGLMKYGE